MLKFAIKRHKGYVLLRHPPQGDALLTLGGDVLMLLKGGDNWGDV